MPAARLLPILPAIAPAILALNNAHAVELSWLEDARLAALLEQAFYARRIGGVEAFLLAFDESADYDSPNYLWFRRRYRRFVYVDRVVVSPAARGRGHARLLYADLFARAAEAGHEVVVSPAARGRGHARLLYADLFERAAEAGHEVVVCEVNSDPPNPASDAFHAAQEFAEVGRAAIHQGSKTVRYLARAIDAASAGSPR